MSKKEKILTIPECALLLAILGVPMDKNDPTNRFLPKSTDKSQSPIRDLVKESYYCLEHGCPPTYWGCQFDTVSTNKSETGKQLSLMDNPSFRVKEEQEEQTEDDCKPKTESSDELFAFCDEIMADR